MHHVKNRLVIVGASGYWGSIITRAAIQLLGTSHVVACDVDRKSWRILTDSLSSQKIISPETPLEYHDILESVLRNEANQYFVIAIPPQFHSKVAATILRKGRRVLLAKPMALSTKEAIKLQRLADKNASLLMVDHTFIFHPAVQKMVAEVKEGHIGVPKSFYARWLSRGKIQEVDVIWDLGPHPISILLEFWQFPIEVSCQVQDENNGVISEATLLLTEKKTGNTATIQLSWMDSDKSRYFKVRGSHHAIVFDDTQDTTHKLQIKGGKVNSHSLLYDGFTAPIYEMSYPSSRNIDFTWVEPLKKELSEFIATTSNSPALHHVSKGVQSVKLLEAAHEAISKGTVHVDI